ncbi:nucleotidyltransferase domain-containing protein [Marinospirillum sp.]|uniref:nucleotidyltransferase domain-containing protein n=1 Tax=Marinospirillum sp. TaxID=2183934 RepID=UPI00384F1028
MKTSKTKSENQSISMLDALFASTKQKVLALFFCHPEKSYQLSEIIAKAKAGSGSVQREVQRLKASHLVSLHQKGREKYYQANPHSPLFNELHSLFEKTRGTEQLILHALQTLECRLQLALIYGSYAKQTDHANSDIDLLLISDSLTLEEVFAALEPVEKQLERQINPTLYTQVEFKVRLEKGQPFITRLLAGPYRLLKGHPDDI